MHRKHLIQLLMLQILLTTTITAVAGVYRWVDDDGRVHFGDRPSVDVNESDEVVLRKQVPASSPANVDRKQSQERLLEQYQRERDEKRLKAEKARQEKERRKRGCAYAQARLSEYQEHGVLYDRLPNQERRYLTDQERNAVISKARQDVKNWCK